MSDLVVIDNEQVALPEARHDLARQVERHIPRVVRMLPSDADRIQFATALMVACNEVDPSKVSDGKSLLGAAVGCVRMGLMPGAELGLAYFVPFKGRVNLIPGYRGYLDLAMGNGQLRWVNTEIVYRGEDFRHWHDEKGPHIAHDIPLERADNDRDIIGAYCTYQTRLADMAVPVVLNRKDIDAAKSASQTDKVWRPHFAEMAMKTAIRRAAKRWKLTPQLAKAVYFDELAERGEPQPLELPEGAEVETTPRKRLADLSTERSESFEYLKSAIGDLHENDRGAMFADIAAALDSGDITEDEAAELRGMLA